MYFISSIHQIFPKIFTQKKKKKDDYYHVKTEWEWSKHKGGRKKPSKTHLFSQFLEILIPGVPNLFQMKNFQFSLCLKSALSIYPKTRDRRMIRKRALVVQGGKGLRSYSRDTVYSHLFKLQWVSQTIPDLQTVDTI